MFAKLKHVAICSDRFNLLGTFYESLFGLRSSKSSSDEPRGTATVGDGYVGLIINSRAPERQAGLDHFGFAVIGTHAGEVWPVFKKAGLGKFRKAKVPVYSNSRSKD